MPDIQQSMFPQEYPDVVLEEHHEPEAPVIPDDFVLIGRRNRAPQWHKLKVRLGGIHGDKAACGLVGWVIAGAYRQGRSPVCPDCLKLTR